MKDGEWHHAAGVLSNGTMILHLDGSRAQSGASGSTVKPSGVTVYNRALSAAEVEEHYRKGQR